MNIHKTAISFVSLIIICVVSKDARCEQLPLGRTSSAPKYTFSEKLQEQEKELEANPLMKRFAQSRINLSSDPHRPYYHYVNPESTMNDGNGLCFWQGRWHLFYQASPPEDRRQHWGHAVSDDLIHWRDLPYAIYPNPEDQCYSGATLVEEGRVIAMYHGKKIGNMVATADDPLLLNWTKLTGKPVIGYTSKGPYRVFDPCVWKKDNMYYSLSGSHQPGPNGERVPAHFLFRSKDLVKWEYMHVFEENDRFTKVGDDGACPYFLPIGEQYILFSFSHMTGGQYLLGDYDKQRDKFVVTSHGNCNFGPYGPAGVHAPTASPDGKGGVIVIFNMNQGKPTHPEKVWNQIMTLPRRFTLEARDKLRIEPAGDIESLRYGHQRVDSLALQANKEIVLENIAGNSMEMIASINTKNAPMIELNVLRSPDAQEYTRIMFFRDRGYKKEGKWQSMISIDSSRASVLPDVVSRAPETAQLAIDKEELLDLRVFIDRSVVEVFANGRQCLAVRVYPGREDSIGVSLRAQGQDATLESLDAWQMKNIYTQSEDRQ